MAASRHRDRPVDFAPRILGAEADPPRGKVVLFSEAQGQATA